MPSGEIEPRQVERLREIGAWLRANGESIYGTRGGPFKPGPWGASTHKGDTIYLHVLNWGDSEVLKLPAIERRIVKASLLAGGKVEFNAKADALELRVPAAQRQSLDTIIALKLDGPAAAIAPR